MKNLSRIVFFFIGLLAFCSHATVLSPVDSSKYYLATQNYLKAENLLKRIIVSSPDNAEAVYLLFAVKQTRILDYESYTIENEQFIQTGYVTVNVLNEILARKHGKDSIQCLFYVGSALGGISIMQAKVGNWPSAIRTGLASIVYFKKVIKGDPSFYPAYLGIGAFNYYLSQNLKWMPFFGDKTAEGIAQIKISTMAGLPYSFAARNTLCWILVDKRQYIGADSIASLVLADFPNNTIFVRLKARIAFWKQDWKAALYWSQKLIELSENRPVKNWSDLFSGYQILISCYDNYAKKKECLYYCQKILSRTIPEPYSKIPYVKKHLKSISDIQKKYLGN